MRIGGFDVSRYCIDMSDDKLPAELRWPGDLAEGFGAVSVERNDDDKNVDNGRHPTRHVTIAT